MTTLPHPLISDVQNPFGIANLNETLLESVRVAAVSLFWLAALPIGAAVALAATLYDALLFLRSTALRLPFLRSYVAIRPLLLRRKAFETRNVWTPDRRKIARR